MLIRCEKCNTLYELDEKLLPPTGAPVQCSKCQFVFKAYPGPREDLAPANAAIAPAEEAAREEETDPERTPGEQEDEVLLPSDAARVPAATASAASAPSRREVAPAGDAAARAQGQPAKRSAPPARPAPAPDEPQFTADGRPIRKVPFPTAEEPAAPAGPRPVLGRVPGRPSAAASGQRRWALVVIPVALAIILAVAFVAWRMLGRRSEGAQRPAEGHSFLCPAGERAPGRVGIAAAVALPSAGDPSSS